MIRVPLKEEEVHRLFTNSEDGLQDGRICQCYCNCDELEPPPRVSNLFFSAFPSNFYKEEQEQLVIVVLSKEKKPPSGILTLRQTTGNWKLKSFTQK